jgi:DnaJ-class molecular chaperone
MRNPYLILGIDEDADDAAVETAYLQGIKRCPPERDAERFEALRQAYETLRTQRKRVAYALFHKRAAGARRHPRQGSAGGAARPTGCRRHPRPVARGALMDEADGQAR